MPRTTVKDVISEVLRKKSPLTSSEVYDEIVKNKLYEFRSKDAASVVATELRRHTSGNPQSKKKKILFIKIDGKYLLKES